MRKAVLRQRISSEKNSAANGRAKAPAFERDSTPEIQVFSFAGFQFLLPLPPPTDIFSGIPAGRPGGVRVQFGGVFQHCFDLYRVRRKAMHYIEKEVRYRFS